MNISVETCDPSTRNQDANLPGGVAGGGGGGGVGGAGAGAGGGPTAQPTLPQAPQGKYSYIHKVVDGITIIVNTVNVKFLSAAFTASVQVSFLLLFNTNKQFVCK